MSVCGLEIRGHCVKSHSSESYLKNTSIDAENVHLNPKNISLKIASKNFLKNMRKNHKRLHKENWMESKQQIA